MLCHGTVCVVGKIRDLILQLSKSSIYSTKPSASKNSAISSSIFCEKYKQTKEQALTFFQEHPQYMRSKEDEEQLMTEFKKVLLEPGSKNLSIYQALLAAHERLQAL
ncbi:hypothetical protein Z592_17820 [Salmonella enterica subsp. enterica serovar Senftenberg]|nr:hypothetical protein [Salmonella enterica subsp. enterica serovar Senftenberg]